MKAKQEDLRGGETNGVFANDFPQTGAFRNSLPEEKRKILDDYVRLGVHLDFVSVLDKYPYSVFEYASGVLGDLPLDIDKTKYFGALIHNIASLSGHPNLTRQLQGDFFEGLSYATLVSLGLFEEQQLISPRETERIFSESYKVVSSSSDDKTDTSGGTARKIPAYSFLYGGKEVPLYMPDGIAIDKNNHLIYVLEYKFHVAQRITNQASLINLFLDLIASDEGEILRSELANQLGIQELKVESPGVIFVVGDENKWLRKIAQDTEQNPTRSVRIVRSAFSHSEAFTLMDSLLVDYCR